MGPMIPVKKDSTRWLTSSPPKKLLINHSTSIILKVKPDSVDQMIKAAAKQVEETRKDPACRYYEVSQNLADPTQFISVQTWKNAQSLVEHCSCEHHHEFTKIIDEVKEGTPQFNMWVSVTSGESSKEDEKNLKLEQEKTKTA